MVRFVIKSDEIEDMVYAQLEWQEEGDEEVVSIGVVSFPTKRIYDDFVRLVKTGAMFEPGIEATIVKI
jgi:hypothetical protein